MTVAGIERMDRSRGSLERAAMMATVRRASRPGDWVEAAALLHDYIEWVGAVAGIDPLVEQPALVAELADLPGHYGGGRDTLFIGRLGDLAAGTVAVRCHDDGGAELKRMYIRPIARGRGLADRLVDRAVGAAVRRGCHTIWLESLPAVMAPAVAVYRRNGFVEIDGGGRTIGVDGVVTMERSLVDHGPVRWEGS